MLDLFFDVHTAEAILISDHMINVVHTAGKEGIWYTQVSFSFIHTVQASVGNGKGVKQPINPSVSAAYHRIRMGTI